MDLDLLRGEIFRLYKSEDLTLTQVIDALKDYDVKVSKKVLKKKLKSWNYWKYKSKTHNRSQFQSHIPCGNDSLNTNHNLTQHQHHHDTLVFVDRTQTTNSTQQLVHIPRLIGDPDKFQIPKVMFLNVENLIKSSFECGNWKMQGYNRIIESSTSQSKEMESLQSFIAKLDMACQAANLINYKLAGQYWGEAFIEIETLVKGNYHDIIPNIIQKINDLCSQGYPEVAQLLRNCLKLASKSIESQNSKILHDISIIEMDHLLDIEDKIMSTFAELFPKYLGAMQYNSFVMRINAARRRLTRDSWVKFEHQLPSIVMLDHMSGFNNVKSLDVLRLRLEILYHREEFEQIKIEAPELIYRASTLIKDEWQNHYFSIKGNYYLVCADYHFVMDKSKFMILSHNNEQNIQQLDLINQKTDIWNHISKVLQLIESFDKIEMKRIFRPEEQHLKQLKIDLQLE